MKNEDKYFFFNSDMFGPKGANARNNGKACLIECDNITELYEMCKRVTSSKNIQYTLEFITVTKKDDCKQ